LSSNIPLRPLRLCGKYFFSPQNRKEPQRIYLKTKITSVSLCGKKNEIMNPKYYLIIILSLFLMPSLNAQKSSSKKKKKQQQETIITIDSSSISVAPVKNIEPNIKYELYVMDKESNNPLPNCRITLIGSDSTSVIKYTDTTGRVMFEKERDDNLIKRNVSYKIIVSKTDYLVGIKTFSTVEENNENFVEEIFLTFALNIVLDFPEIQFYYDKWDLLVEEGRINSYDSLDYLYQIMIDNPTIIVEIQNHTDCRGKPQYSTSLSQRRAQACLEYLVTKGISKDRLIANGYRSQVPRGPGLDCESIKKLPSKEDQEKAHQLNRRTQFKVLSFDYKPTDN
jgi:outer membrane protein OmpA-like peptidoglycan-associated protein